MRSEKECEYDLIDIVRDPGIWVYETLELSDRDHYYEYRYDSSEEVFYRATVPAGAAAIHFRPLPCGAKVPVSGWLRVERKSMPVPRLRLVAKRTASF
jgi:hypothetical protein